MADDAAVLAEAAKVPLGEQLGHSSWKVRAQALETIKTRLGRAFSTEDEIFSEAGPLLAKAAGDTNANVMDKGVEALVAFLEKADEGLAARIAGPAAAVLAGKCLKGKPGTVAKAGEACLLLVELEQQAPVVEAVLKAFSDKVPKVVLAAVDILLQAVSAFGAKAIDPKPIMKALPALFGHSQAGVRDKAKEVSVQLAAYLGAGVVAGVLLDKMPAAMRKDVDAAIADLPPGKQQPSRYTRREAAERAARDADAAPMDVDGEDGGEGGAAGAAEVVEEEQEGDPYDYAAPVDILALLAKAQCQVDDDPPVAFWAALEDKKWGLRKAALEKVKELGSTPRLATGDYGDLVRHLKKILGKDSIVPVAVSAADVAAVLASGLRDNFSSQAKSLCAPLLERFKEKNIVMSKSSEESLRTLSKYCFSLADVVEDVVAAMDHKNPKVKRETARFVKDALESTPKALLSRMRDTLLPALAKLAGAGESDVREAAQAALVAFAVRAGSMSALDKVMDKVDDARKKKIEEMVQEAIAQGGASGSKPAAAAAARPPPARSASGVSAGSSRPGTARSSPKALAPKNLNRVGSGTGAAAKGGAAGGAVRRTASGTGGPTTRARAGAGAGGAGAAEKEEDLSVGKLNNEELEERMVASFGAPTVELLRSAKWQERVEAMGSVLSAVQDMGDPGARCYELVQCVAFLPGWSDKNFQVINKEFEVITHLARAASAFSRRDAALALGGLADKIHELKHKVQVYEGLTALSEAVGPQFVMAELHKRAAANKNPKVLAEALGWMAEVIPEFGLAVMDVKAIIEWCKADLGSANAPVRNRAMEVLGKCHAQLGPALTDFLEGLKPAQLMALEEYFRQNPKAQIVPTRTVRSKKKGGAAAAAAAGGAAAAGVVAAEEEEEEGSAAALNPDDLLPRTDISGSITPALVGMISSSNWKERNAGVDQVTQLLAEASHRITPNVGELFSVLKGRMTDSNRNLTAKVLVLLGDVARAMGPPFDKAARSQLLIPAVHNMADNKKQVRDGVIYMLDSWITVATADKLFPAVAEAVANPKCLIDGKIAAMQWITKVVAEGNGKKGVDSALRAAALGCADKAVSVREAGSALLTELATQLGPEAVSAAVPLLVSADRKLAQEAISKVLGSATAGTASAAAPSAASSRPATAASRPGTSAAGRPGTSRAAGGRGAAAPAASVPAPVAVEVPAGAILAFSDGKAERARKYRPRPGKFDGISPEEPDLLQRELTAVTSPEWAALLFSKDFKRHLDACEMLLVNLADLLREVAASLDLILRWAVLRICDGNMQSLVKVLETCKAVLEALAAEGYSLTDYEALLFLPAVVEKAGHNQDRVRALHRDVLRLCSSMHPPPRVVDFLAQGLASKSNRTKIECCEEIACIIEREGMHPIQTARSKPLAAIAALLKERDGATRTAALLAIEQAWVEEGEGVMRLMGRLESREQDMVQEKLKRSTKQPKVVPMEAAPAQQPTARHRPDAFVPRDPYAAAPEAAAHQAGTPPGVYGGLARAGGSGEGELMAGVPGYGGGAFGRASTGGEETAVQYRAAFTPPNALATPMGPRPVTGHAADARQAVFGAAVAAAGPRYAPTAPSAAPTPVPGARPYTAPVGAAPPPMVDDGEFDQRWGENMRGIASPDVDEAVESMKLMCGDIMLAMQGLASTHMLAIMAQSADPLFSTVNQQLLRIFSAAEAAAAADGSQPSSRGAKYALNIMLQGLNVDAIAGGLTSATLRTSISLLLLRLLDERGLLHYEEGATLVKAVNVLMLKILECSNRTYAFAALLQLLRDPPLSVTPESLHKFYDLVVKCLIKLTKGLQATAEGVDLSELLFCIHDFFLYLGVDEIRKRSSSDDKPLRMVKTILHELCKMMGYDIYHYAASIPGRDADPQPIIFAYISLNLQSLTQSGLIAPPVEGGQQPPAAAPATGPLPAGHAGSDGTVTVHEQAAAAAAEVRQVVQQALSDQQKAELKVRLKDVMGSLMHRDQSAAAMRELYVMRKEYPAFVERYIASTSDMFKTHIERGLAALDQEMGGAAANGTPDARHQQQLQQPAAAAPQQQQYAAPAPAAQHRVPPLELQLQQRPHSSGIDSARGHGGAPSPGAAYSPVVGSRAAASAERLSSLRERLGQMRVSGDGSGGGTAGNSMPATSRSAAADLGSMSSSLEGLQARLASLQGRRTSEQG